MKTKLKKLVRSAKCLVLSAALCAVGLSAFAEEPEAVQLWEGGPSFANLCDTSDLAHYWYTDSVNADHTFYGLYKQLKSADKGEREAATKHAKWFADDYREHVVECKEAIRKNPRNPQDWQTVHLTAYDIDKKTFLIGVQENFGELFIGGLDMETRRFRANKISSK